MFLRLFLYFFPLKSKKVIFINIQLIITTKYKLKVKFTYKTDKKAIPQNFHQFLK